MVAVLVVVFCSPTAALADTPAERSALWGVDGELFDPAGRLMDWSYAGYQAGEQELPWHPATVALTDHGAVPDDGGDDTAAFLLALDAAAGGGVIDIPAGTFELRDKIMLPDGVVLRGAGSGITIIDIPVSLTDVYGNPRLDSGGQSTYSFSQAFIEARGTYPSTTLATITANASRGDTSIRVSSADDLVVGEWIHIIQTDADSGLMNRLHADLMTAGPDLVGDRGMDFHTRISAIDGDVVEIERALPVDVDTRWSPQLRPFAPTGSEIGVEHLTIRFPLTPYPGHFAEQGYNAIDFRRVANSWVRDVEVLNSDYGVNIRDCFFVTVQDVVLATTGDRGSIVGHHGINNGEGSDNLFIGFDIRATFQHDVANEWYATGVVFTKGRGDNLRMDHHCAAPYSTLWTEIDAGEGTTPWTSGGSGDRCPHTAAYDTIWNVRADRNMVLPGNNYGPRMNFVGFQTAATEATSPYDWWLETIAPDDLEPSNIWEAMRARRLGPPSTLFSPIPYYGDSENYRPLNPRRWEVSDVHGGARYRLASPGEQTDSGGLGEYALVADQTFGDFTMSLRVRTAESIATNRLTDYAVVFAYQDEDNYAYLMANATEGESRLFRVEDGVRADIAPAEVVLIPDEGWHSLALSRDGDRITVSFDGSEVLSTDAELWDSGALGVGSFNDIVDFDDIDVVVPEPTGGDDVGGDTGSDVGEDTGSDVGEDTGSDVGEDTRTDVGDNTGTDVGDDTGTDVGGDAGEDARSDVDGPDADDDADDDADSGGNDDAGNALSDTIGDSNTDASEPEQPVAGCGCVSNGAASGGGSGFVLCLLSVVAIFRRVRPANDARKRLSAAGNSCRS